MNITADMTALELLRFLREFDLALSAPRKLRACEYGHHECSTVPTGPCHVDVLGRYRELTGSLAH